jgi:predicted enzyme related to lactoylglutathione lyase
MAAASVAALLGWTPTPVSGSPYVLFELDGVRVAGMLPLDMSSTTSHPHWATYFAVRDANEVARKSVSLGAEIILPIHDASGIGRSCGVRSPQGVPFYVIQYER